MKQRHTRVASVVVAALAVGLGASACDEDDWPVQGEGAPGIDTSINREVLQYLDDNDLPGATVAVTRAGRLVWSTAYGWANESEQIRMKPWHRSRIGSVSKVITAVGLLQLLEPQSGRGDLGGFSTGGTDLASQLSRKLYGHPGTNVNSPAWPSVTGPAVLDNPEVYWEAIRTGVQNAYPQTYETEMATMIEWASQVELRHLLSHTANYISSGDVEGAADYFGVAEADLTYSQAHLFNLLGVREGDESGSSVKCWRNGEFYVAKDDPAYDGTKYVLPPLLNEPGTKECYSNHGFGVAGMVIDELAGPSVTYHQAIRQNILDPLGLSDVVPNNTNISELDAWPHGSALDPSNPTVLGAAAGGWSASAQDLARIMCGLDRTSNNLRLLAPATVTTMESVAFPAASSTQPLGWDSISNNRLYKNGNVGGGGSVIIKYLPGRFDAAPADEINVAINVNSDGTLPPESLLESIAKKVAEANIPDDYDLFDPAYACVVEDEPGLVIPTVPPSPTATEPTLVVPTTPPPTVRTDPTVVVPNPTRTQRATPPQVTIHLPYNGWHPAPNRKVTVAFNGSAVDSSGAAIPGTRLRWTATEQGKTTVLCAGSDFGPPPSTIGGIVAQTNCSTFNWTFTNPVFGSGPSITIKLEAKDAANLTGSDEVIIALYTPPPPPVG